MRPAMAAGAKRHAGTVRDGGRLTRPPWRSSLRCRSLARYDAAAHLVELDNEMERLKAGRRKVEAPPLPKIEPIDGVSIERQVYKELRYALMSGSIRPGISLSSRSLSNALGVSGTPVREALKRLDSDGALVSRNKSAFFVYDPDKTDFSELFHIRLALEGHAIREAARRVTRRDLLRLREINDRYYAILDGNDPFSTLSMQVNFQFHFEVYKLSGSDILVDMIETLWLRVGPTLQRYKPTNEAVITVFHNEMLDALTKGDAEAAFEALRNDLTTAYKWILPYLRDRN